jgi:hypothetical protein
MSHNGTVRGYAAYKVADHVNYHEASMMGMYDVLINTEGEKIAIDNSIEVPDSKGVTIHHACNVCISLDDMGGFVSVINGQVPSTYFADGAGSRFFILDYAGSSEPDQWERPAQVTNIHNSKALSSIKIYPNPVSDNLYVSVNEPVFNQITISNIAGKVQYFSKIKTNETLLKLDLKYLKEGFYLVTLSGDAQSETFKMIRK